MAFCKIAYSLLFVFSFVSCSNNGLELDVTARKASLNPTPKVYRVYGDGTTYCAFTSMIIHDGSWYLAFREGMSHQDETSSIVILQSDDGVDWKRFQVITAPNIDLRDPGLSVMPDGVMLLICGARMKRADGGFCTKTYYSKCLNGRFDDVSPIHLPAIIDDNDCSWLWRLTWNGDIGYGAVYRSSGSKNNLTLVKTEDGISYEVITDIREDGYILTETKIRFLDNQTMVAMIRSNRNGFIGFSKPPFKDWELKQLDVYLAGHDFIIDQTRVICATRHIDFNDERTYVFCGDLSGCFDSYIKLPSYGESGDTSYSSIVDNNDAYYVSYYSKHETEKPCIYLAIIEKLDK